MLSIILFQSSMVFRRRICVFKLSAMLPTQVEVNPLYTKVLRLSRHSLSSDGERIYGISTNKYKNLVFMLPGY
jgi:hypothetical protein